MSERVIVCGSRRWHDRAIVADRLFDLDVNSTIVVGYDPNTDQPRGADRIAYQEAQKLGLLVEPHPADWETFGLAAGPIRNRQMADLGAVLCLAFRKSGTSKGTDDMMRAARAAGIPVEVITPDGNTTSVDDGKAGDRGRPARDRGAPPR